MAIRIPILTSFDPKGLKQANAQFAKLQTSVGSLGRNFAVAGTAIVAGTALLGKAVQSASNFEAEFEGVNQVFGQAAKSVQNFAEQAAQSAGLSATEALRASKTFGLFATGAGLGVEQAAKFSTTMVQLAGDLGSFNDVPTAEALASIQSGLMGQAEPLRKFGVFLDENRLKQALFNATGQEVTGTLDSQQKMMAAYYAILQQTTVQQGDYIKYQDTLGNQLKTISTEFENLSKDIGLMLIPAITQALPQIKEMARSLGAELKAAIKSVDWESLTTTIVNLVRFFGQNAETILKVVSALFVLNTAFKVLTISVGLSKMAMDLYTWAVARASVGMGTATVAATVLRTALLVVAPFAVVAAITAVAGAMAAVASDARLASDGVTDLYNKTRADLISDPWKQAANPTSVYVGLIRDARVEVNGLNTTLRNLPAEVKTKITISTDYDRAESRRLTEQAFGRGSLDMSLGKFDDPTTKTTGGATPKPTPSPLQQLFADPIRNEKAAKQTVKLQTAGLSEAVAAWITSVDKPVVAAREAQARISKNGAKAIANLTKKYEKSSAGQAAAAAAAASSISESFTVAYDDTADKEAAALAERQRVFASFADSVKSTFAGMKNGIINAFDLTELGGSSNAITRNMEKLLTRLKSFATNVKNLASMGLNPALLQQVISAGPLGGARLAEALVMGGAGGLSAINAGYSEFGALSSQIAQTGTESLFNQGAQQTVYNINVDGGVGSGSTIGKAIVDAIKAYERTSGAVWQGA